MSKALENPVPQCPHGVYVQKILIDRVRSIFISWVSQEDPERNPC